MYIMNGNEAGSLKGGRSAQSIGRFSVEPADTHNLRIVARGPIEG